MATLHVLKGHNQGEQLELTGEQFVIGRDPPQCNLVIPTNAVSRVHAQISRVGDKFYIEDMQSRNKTYLNNEAVEKRTLLRNNDKIRICDFLAAFQDGPPFPPLPADLAKPTDEDEAEESGGSTTVEA